MGEETQGGGIEFCISSFTTFSEPNLAAASTALLIELFVSGRKLLIGCCIYSAQVAARALHQSTSPVVFSFCMNRTNLQGHE